MNRREILRYAALATGAAISAPLASAFLTGCKQEPVVEPYVPTFFSEQQYNFITKFADIVIPPTDTPGASDVGVPAMIDTIVGQVYGEESKAKTKTGLEALMAKINADHPEPNGFNELSDDARLQYLQKLDNYYKNPETDWEALGEEEELLRDAYFSLKQSTIAYYFGSEEVAKNQLAYLAVPGEYIGCGDLQELTGGISWAL